MTDHRQEQPTALAPVASATAPQLLREERLFVLRQREAKVFADSSIVPEAYRGNHANVIIALGVAERIGADPFAVMQNLDIIHGRPSWRATFLIATVNTCGRFSALRFRFEGERGTSSWGCCAYAKDRETSEELVGELITIKMADDEGWSKKSGSKWKTMPGQMLRYRAAAFWTRVFAPELSLGMHTTEESEDIHAFDERRPSGSDERRAGGQVSAIVDVIAKSVERRLPPAEPKPEQTAEPEIDEIDEDSEREPDES